MAKPLFSWRQAVVESDLSATTKHVLLTISLHMNEFGTGAWPSIRTLADETSLNKSTVQDHVAVAEQRGFLNVENRDGNSNLYAVQYPEDAGVRPTRTPDGVYGQDVRGVRPNLKKGLKVVGQDVHNSSEENSRENSTLSPTEEHAARSIGATAMLERERVRTERKEKKQARQQGRTYRPTDKSKITIAQEHADTEDCWRIARGVYAQRFDGQLPTWTKKHRAALSDFLCETSIELPVFRTCWQNYLDSTDPFVVDKMAYGLNYFLGHFDEFRRGPKKSDVRTYPEEPKDSLRPPSRAKKDCAKCGGTGWEIIPNRGARECPCLKS